MGINPISPKESNDDGKRKTREDTNVASSQINGNNRQNPMK
jgi:hypothetical protein